ncbi:hypothetical protein DTL42_15360 [Bremerella cremea]|uniref:AAA domain-containing protein n=1 Tax=Bremerella cremea TaxID=1031537 RepID=A0A368KP63_9BACT|nr:AAA family ATPase [Bremerella cremea]RCS46344.1 hypothetical protein DTL42_15360 [Bremerella cremea]
MSNGNLVIPSDNNRQAASVNVPGRVVDVRSSDEDSNRMGQVVHSLRRQWLASVVLGVLLAVPIGVGVWLLQAPKYSSSAYLRISANDQPLAFKTVEQAARNDFRTFKNTQVQLMITPFVLSKALGKDGIINLPVIAENENPLEWLQKELQVRFPGDAEILQVSMSSADPTTAMKIVNAVVGAYQEEVIESERMARVRRLDNLERVYNETEAKARSKRSDLRTLAETLGTSDSDTLSLAQQGSVQHYGLVRNELAQVRFDLMRAQGELDFLTSSNSSSQAADKAQAEPSKEVEKTVSGENAALPVGSDQALVADAATVEGEQSEEIEPQLSEVEMNEAISSDPISVKLQAELDRFEEPQYTLTPAAYQRYRETNSAAIKSLESRLKERREHLELLVKERIAQDLAAQAKGEIARKGSSILAVPEVDNTLPDLRVRVGVLKQQEETLAAEVAVLEKEVRTYGRSSVEVEMMRSEIEGLDSIVQQLSAEIERTKIELRGTPRITLLSKAEPGTVTDKKRPIMITAAAALAGLVLPGGLLVLRDFQKKRLSDLPTTRDELGLEILGTIPRLPRGITRKPKALAVNLGPFEDRVRDSSDSVAATILRRAATQKCQVLLISSAMPQEGKSSLTCHLAISLANAGRRVVIVDFDLRRPSMHRILGLPIGPGVSDLLAGQAELADVVKATDIPNVSFLPAGVEEQSISRGATSGVLDAILGDLRKRYDFVIVDAGPVLGSPSTRLLAQPQYVDGVILSVFKDVSQVTQVEDAKRVLTSFGAPILGTVLSGYSTGMYYSYTARTKSTVEVAK